MQNQFAMKKYVYTHVTVMKKWGASNQNGLKCGANKNVKNETRVFQTIRDNMGTAYFAFYTRAKSKLQTVLWSDRTSGELGVSRECSAEPTLFTVYIA